MKDPAFLFYSSDFLSGIQDLTMEERGQYITLLCLQHLKGHLTEKTIMLTCHGNAAADVMAKFRRDPAGLWYNERLEEEIQKRRTHTDKQRERAVNGWQKRKNNTTAHAAASPAALPLENENEDENENVIENVIENKKTARAKIEIENPFGVAGQRMWKAWKDYKREEHRKSYKSEKTEQQAVNALYEMAGGQIEIASKIIQQSISNQWQGLFPLKNTGNAKQQSTTTLRADVQAEFERRFGDR
jgi:hypothetical protein